MDIPHYPFRFVQKIDEPWDGPQGFLLYKLLYSFKSTKSNQTFMLTLFGNEEYRHFVSVPKSAYILINRKALQEYPNLIEDVVEGFKTLYPYFE